MTSFEQGIPWKLGDLVAFSMGLREEEVASSPTACTTGPFPV
jgi:hypothetical protein